MKTPSDPKLQQWFQCWKNWSLCHNKWRSKSLKICSFSK